MKYSLMARPKGTSEWQSYFSSSGGISGFENLAITMLQQMRGVLADSHLQLEFSVWMDGKMLID